MRHRRKRCISILMIGNIAQATSIVDQKILLHFLVMQDVKSDHSSEFVYDFRSVESLLSMKIGDLLQNSSQPEKDLSIYMRDVQKAIRTQQLNQQQLKSKYTDVTKRHAICLQQKRIADRDFFQGTKNGMSDEMLETVSSDAATAAACAERARVKAHAYNIMLKKSHTYQQKLEKRFALIRANESFILQNIDLIETDPKTIIQVNRLMRKLQ